MLNNSSVCLVSAGRAGFGGDSGTLFFVFYVEDLQCQNMYGLLVLCWGLYMYIVKLWLQMPRAKHANEHVP